jgi:hypothetical protein
MLNLAPLNKIHFITGAAFLVNGAATLITARLEPGR